MPDSAIDERKNQRRLAGVRALLGFCVRTAAMLVVQALVLVAMTALLSGRDTLSFDAAILVAAVMAVINAVLWPLVIRVALPLTIVTFGLGSLALSAGMVALAFYAVDGKTPSFWTDVAIAFGLALVSMLVAPLLDVDGDARHLRIVRRRVKRTRRENHTDAPGVILFEIDGLGENVLREAIRDGHTPTIARWLADGSHRLLGWECDLSSQTGASQAGLLLGSNWDMPAFRWYEKESGRTMVSNHPADAAEIERRRSTGAGLLASAGTSRGNMFSGDAPRCTATMSVIRDRSRSKAADLFAYFSDPYGFMRTIVLSLADIAYERSAASRQRRSGAAHVDRKGLYPLIRATIAVIMRDLVTALLMADIVEGVPVSYATFVGYDEVAHHSGIREPDALAVLKRHDRQLARLERATAQSPRPYHLVVLSDHGQTQGAPFRQRYGETLEDVVRRALAQGEVFAPAAVDEAWGDVGAVLADARQEPSVGGRMLARATRSRSVDGTVALGPNREALAEREASGLTGKQSGGRPTGSSDADVNGTGAKEAIVMASGGLGLIYLPASPERLTVEQINEVHPRLLDTLAAHPGIGYVMVRSRENGALVIGGAGRRRLSDDAIEGDDPLADFDPTAADHLRRHDGFPHCPDILVNCMYDPGTEEVAPFEEFMGSHGGLGGPQTKPFAVVPAEWSESESPIIGVEAMHEALRDWLAQSQPRAAERAVSA
ncbi:MAG TPA: phage holin family protein [Solirubrobacteraceae bacterium]|nr:phage holin family protein [Solirubrobacteraceae bacterium]